MKISGTCLAKLLHFELPYKARSSQSSYATTTAEELEVTNCDLQCAGCNAQAELHQPGADRQFTHQYAILRNYAIMRIVA
jgi:hypothetical protein